ncbi:hypothetical protein EJD97_018799, partial [Solanum chilense]
MNSTVNTFASSEMISISSIAANPSSLVATESSMEIINLPPDARQKGPMPPSFPTSSEFNQGDHFTTFQQTQSASLTHSTQDTPLMYTFAPAKAPTVTHYATPVYTYVTTPPVTKAQEFHHQDVNDYVETESDAKLIDAEMMSRKMKILENYLRGLCGFGSRQSV